MADISKLTRILNGIARQVDLSTNTLVVSVLKVGGGAGTDLTKTILDNLINLQNGTDFSTGTNSHTHDGRYFTESELGSATASSGSDLIGDDNTYSNLTPAAATVKGALSGTDTALGTKVTGPASATDEAIARFDGTTGKLVQNSSVTISDAGIMSGATQLNVDNVRIDGNTVSATTGDLILDGADIDANNNIIKNVATPTADSHAATKAYVDSVANGLDWKNSVRAATTAAGTLATSFENLDVIDGVTLATGDRILIKDQAAGAENGIYIVQASGAPVRAADADTSTEVTSGLAVFVAEGTVNADSGWVLTTNDPITLGTTALVFTQFNGAGGVTAGAGLTKTGNTLDVGAGDGISVAADSVAVNVSDLVGQGIENDGSNNFRIAASAAGAGLTGGAGSALAVGAGDGISVAADSISVNVTDLVGSGIENDGSNNFRIASAAYDQSTITGGAGSAAAVQYAPAIKSSSEVAGEALSATTVYALRYGQDAETAGRSYKADNDATTTDNFYVYGIVKTVGALSAADPIPAITKSGLITLTSHGFTVGKPVYLGASGALTSTAPTTANTAVVKIGMVKDVNTIDIQIQVMGVN